MSRWRVAARLARREVRRHWIRSALVVLIIALPVLAAQGAAIAARATQWSDGSLPSTAFPQDAYPAYAGADEYTGFDPRLGRPPAVVGAARVETGFFVRDWTFAAEGEGRGPDDLASIHVVGFIPDASDVPLAEGRHPRTRHEVTVSSSLADRADLVVGDRMEAIASRVELTVVGIGSAHVRPIAWAGPPRDEEDDWVPEALVRIRDSGAGHATAEMFDLYWAPDGGALAPDPLGREVTKPPALRRDLPAETVVGGAAGAAIAVGFVATVCSAAFAIGARRQLRDLGLLATTGASPGDLVRAVILQGTTLGVVGVALSTVLAFLGRAVVVHRYVPTERWDVPWSVGLVLAVGVLGIVAGTAAALVPALTASRIPTLSALAGRRPLRRRPLRSPYAGVVLVVAGLALLSWASGSGTRNDGAAIAASVVGVLATMGGAVALSPAVVAGLARLCSRRGGTVRLAGRSLARDGMRSASIVATVAVAVAIPVVVLVWGGRETWTASSTPASRARAERVQAAERATGQAFIEGPGSGTDLLDSPVTARAREVLGPDVVATREILVFDDRGTAQGVAVDPDELRRVTGDDEVADALEEGKVVVPPDADAEWCCDVGDIDPEALDIRDRDSIVLDLSAASDLTVAVLNWSGRVLVPASLAEEVPDNGNLQLYRPGPVTEAEAERLNGLSTGGTRDPVVPTVADLRELRPVDVVPSNQILVTSNIQWYGSDEGTSRTELLVFLGSVLVALAVIGMASALGAADGRSDALVVAAVGAPPTIVRRRRALEATLTAAGAAVLGGGLGILATLAVIHHPGFDETGVEPVLRFPFLDVLGVVVGTVVVVGGVTWLALAVGGRLRGRRDLFLVDA
ncbi:MAG TPA: FtsX-like permease family protein [Iamia sp.]